MNLSLSHSVISLSTRVTEGGNKLNNEPTLRFQKLSCFRFAIMST
jgi:hypothetical protein